MPTSQTSSHEPSAAEIQAGLNAVVRGTLRPAAIVLVIAYACLTVAHPLVLPPASRHVMTAMAAATLLLALGIAWYLFRVEVPAENAHRWAGLMLGLVTINLAVHVALTPEPALAGNLLVLMVAAGCFLLSHVWFAAVMAASLAVWLGGAIGNPAADWGETAHLVGVSAIISLIVYRIRYRTYSQYERLQLQLEQSARHLQERLELEQILTRISTQFLDLTVEEIDAAIEEAMGEVGKCLAVDHACVRRVEGPPPSLSLIYEWSAPGIAAEKSMLQKVPATKVPWCWKQIEANQTIQAGRLADLPDEAETDRPFLEERGLRSFLCVPLTSEGCTWGIMALEKFNKEAVWSNEISNLIRVLGEIILASLKRKATEKEIVDLNQRLEQTSRLVGLGEMAANLAHELSNGLSAISLQTKGAFRRADRGTLTLEKCRQCIGEIDEQSDRLAAMLLTIQKFARHRICEKKPVNLQHVLEDVELLIGGKLRQHQVRLECPDLSTIPPVVGDPAQITLVAVNLVLNAAQAISNTEPDKRRITVSIDNDHPDFLEVSIRDQADGFSPELSEKIFEKFYTTKADGLGLGLTFSRSYIEQHGGKLWCDSQPGQGSDFRFTLPKQVETPSEKERV